MTGRILVTGALGNVGIEVVRSLLNTGASIRAADIDEERLKQTFEPSVECVHFDFTDPTSYVEAFTGVEKMFLMRPPQLANIKRDMIPALDAAKRAGVKHVVFLSLIGIENAKFVPHYKIETYLKEQGFETTFLRCSFFMQNLNTTHCREIKERDEIFVPVGNARTSFIDVRDIGAVAAKCLIEQRHVGRDYDLTGTESLDYWQASEVLSEILKRKITYRNPNPLYFLLKTVRQGTPLPFAFVMLGLYTSTRFGMAEPVTEDVRRLLDREPITFRQYVQDFKEAWL